MSKCTLQVPPPFATNYAVVGLNLVLATVQSWVY
jgi:hypothetical protein